MRNTEKGYLILVLIILIGALEISLLEVKTLRVNDRKREKEFELQSILLEYHRGITGYLRINHTLPLKLEDMLASREKTGTLRRVYQDPFTREKNWKISKTSQGISRIQSSSPEIAIDKTKLSDWHIDKKGNLVKVPAKLEN